MYRKIIASLTAASCLLLGGCHSKNQDPTAENAAIPVKATKPDIKDMTAYVDSIGTLAPSVFMEVRPQVDGSIIEVMTTEGQVVTPGMSLFKIDAKPYAMKVKEAEAQLAFDRVNLQVAQKKLERIKPLVQKDLISQTEWDDLEAEAGKASAAVKLDQARLESAQLDLDHCTIVAPTSGRVGKLDVRAGRLVARGQAEPLATIAQLNPLLVEFNLTEKEFPKVPKDAVKIEVTTLCTSGICKAGEITFLDNHFDKASGLMAVRGKIDNGDHALRPGQSVQVRVPIAVTSKAILIPQKAIRYNQQGPYVYIVQADQSVAVRQIVLGDEHGNDQVVLDGIDPNEQFILDGHLRLSPGIKVDIKS